MRPSIDEQLDGVAHLLDVAASESDLGPASIECLDNARRLLKQIGRSWATLWPFYEQDNADLAEVLRKLGAGSPEPEPDAPADDVRALAERNGRLRTDLSNAIVNLPPGPAGEASRRELLSYLQRRVETDPS